MRAFTTVLVALLIGSAHAGCTAKSCAPGESGCEMRHCEILEGSGDDAPSTRGVIKSCTG